MIGANSYCFDETARMRKLVCTFAVRIRFAAATHIELCREKMFLAACI